MFLLQLVNNLTSNDSLEFCEWLWQNIQIQGGDHGTPIHSQLIRSTGDIWTVTVI